MQTLDPSPQQSLADDQSIQYAFVQAAIKEELDRHDPSMTVMKLLLPVVDGYVVRNDIIERRFLTTNLAEKVADFSSTRQHIRVFDCSSDGFPQRGFSDAIGAVLLKPLPGTNRQLAVSALDLLEAEITARLSFPWVTEAPLPRKRVAVVDGRPNLDASAAGVGIYRAAKALGIDLVIIDQDGHWAQSPSMAHLRDEFIACDMTVDKSLPDRIVQAVGQSEAPIDALTTFIDTRLVETAKAAEKLGLYTTPSDALQLCRDKHQTRKITSPNMNFLTTTGTAHLEHQLQDLKSRPQYPLVIKPTQGCLSEGVLKVETDAEFHDALRQNEEKFPGATFLVEPYASGPEIDANFILLAGQLIWNEANDDFPSAAEYPSIKGVKANDLPPSKSFAEMATIMPSKLPESELSLVESTLVDTLRKLGLENGIFHLEARIQDSRMEYAETNNGLELVDAPPQKGQRPNPSVFLVEVNARPPGHQETYAVEYTYGIDYFAVHMLMALTPLRGSAATHHPNNNSIVQEIIHTLNQPLPPPYQYPINIVFIPAERGGTFVTAKLPPTSLMAYIPHHKIFMRKGDVIKAPDVEGKWPFVAYFLVLGKMTGAEGREQVRVIGELVRESFIYEME